MNYDVKQSGDRIRRLRMNAGYTQEKMAEELNVDRSFYGRIETGKKGCSIDLLVQLSQMFDVSLDYLILGRCSADVTNSADRTQVKESIQRLIDHLERFKASVLD